jgi:hypothetical protein
MATCANPDCPDADEPFFLREKRHVQIIEHEYHTTGERPALGTVLHPFAAVACSLRCAMAALAPAVEREERERERSAERLERMFGGRSED